MLGFLGSAASWLGSNVGSWLPAAADLVGGLLGRDAQKDANQQNADFQREFAQHGIQWKVEDAKAAGVHPLYALGASGATYTPAAQPVMTGDFVGKMGQSVARAAAASSNEQRALQAAQLEVLKAQAQKDYALAAEAQSATARNIQEGRASTPIQFLPEGVTAQSYPVRPQLSSKEIDFWQSARDIGPGQVVNLQPYEAGPEKAGMRVWLVPGIGRILLPDASNMSEAVESLENPVNQGLVLAANLAHFGPEGRKRLEALSKAAREGVVNWIRGEKERAANFGR